MQYPYYTICDLDGGLLVKWAPRQVGKSHKWTSLEEAKEAAKQHPLRQVPWKQLVILEYTAAFRCRIVACTRPENIEDI